MKKIYLLLSLCIATAANAQVPNSTFEASTGYGGENVSDWGQFFMYQVTIGENGENTADEITFGDNALGTFCLSVEDAHSGNRAMLIRNGFNVTQNKVLPGNVNLINSAISPNATGWNNGVPVAPDADIEMFGFWYKFAPAGNDTAEGTLELFDANGQSVGKAVAPISGTGSQYEYVYVPINFTSNATPTFMTINFSMAPEGSEATFGSLLYIDDVRVNFQPLGISQQRQSQFTVWPTMAENQINIAKSSDIQNGKFTMTITDSSGKTVRQQSLDMTDSTATIDISALSSGAYFLKVQSGATSSVTRFIKK